MAPWWCGCRAPGRRRSGALRRGGRAGRPACGCGPACLVTANWRGLITWIMWSPPASSRAADRAIEAAFAGDMTVPFHELVRQEQRKMLRAVPPPGGQG